jgi:hypothetical protein
MAGQCGWLIYAPKFVQPKLFWQDKYRHQPNVPLILLVSWSAEWFVNFKIFIINLFCFFYFEFIGKYQVMAWQGSFSYDTINAGSHSLDLWLIDKALFVSAYLSLAYKLSQITWTDSWILKWIELVIIICLDE